MTSQTSVTDTGHVSKP